MFCAQLPQVMKMKDEYLSKWGMAQLKDDAKTAQDRRRPTMQIKVRHKHVASI